MKRRRDTEAHRGRAVQENQRKSEASTLIDQGVKRALEDGEFKGRRFAWIAQHQDLFLKIPRMGDVVLEDLSSDKVRTLAEQEFRDLNTLADLCSSVVRPLCVVTRFSCLVLPLLRGTELRPLLLNPIHREQSRGLVRAAVEIVAEIHRKTLTADLNGYKLRDYLLPRPVGTQGHSAELRRVLVVEGFEVRNLFLSTSPRHLWFFDPHELAVGYPEEDMARLVLSLLMLNWGRSPRCKPWVDFSYGDMLEHYGRHAGYELRRDQMQFAFKYALELRKSNATRSIVAMVAPIRPIARLYSSLYFGQVLSWAARNGL